MRNLSAAVLVFSLLFAGCDPLSTIKDGYFQSQTASDMLLQKTGHKPFVGFNWNNGTLTNVSVTFDCVLTDKSLGEIEALTREVIGSSFKQRPEAITLSFMTKPIDTEEK